MTATAKWIIGIVILIVIVGGIYYWRASSQPHIGGQESVSTTSPNGSGSETGSDSDAALESDSASIDAQINSFSSDDASANSSLNDQPVQQSSL